MKISRPIHFVGTMWARDKHGVELTKGPLTDSVQTRLMLCSFENKLQLMCQAAREQRWKGAAAASSCLTDREVAGEI